VKAASGGALRRTHRCWEHASIAGRYRGQKRAAAAAFELWLLAKIGLRPTRTPQLIASCCGLELPCHLSTRHGRLLYMVVTQFTTLRATGVCQLSQTPCGLGCLCDVNLPFQEQL